MTEVYDMARKLGTMIQSTPQWEIFESTEKAFKADEEAQKLVADYNQAYQEFQMKMQQGGISPEEQQSHQQNMQEFDTKIKENEVISSYSTAGNTFNQFMDSIMQMISSTLTGEEPEEGGCSPSDCSSCGGGCGCGH